MEWFKDVTPSLWMLMSVNLGDGLVCMCCSRHAVLCGQASAVALVFEVQSIFLRIVS